MPSLLLLLAVSLLRLHHLGNSAEGPASENEQPSHPFYELTSGVRARLLRAKLGFIGCYNATFNITTIFHSSPTDFDSTCKNIQFALSRRISFYRVFGDGRNLCMGTPYDEAVTREAKSLGRLDSGSCQVPQYSCTMRYKRTGIFLSESISKTIKTTEGNPYGSNATPQNCNASGFAPWLQARLNALPEDSHSVFPGDPLLEFKVTVSDVVLDPVCEAFMNRLPPEAGSKEGATELLTKANNERCTERKKQKEAKAARTAKTSTTHPDLAHKPKRPKMVHSCSTSSLGVRTPNEHMQVCPKPGMVDECYVPSPAANEVAPMVQNRPRPNQAIEEKQSWVKLFGFSAGELDNFDNLDDVNAFVGFFDDDPDS